MKSLAGRLIFLAGASVLVAAVALEFPRLVRSVVPEGGDRRQTIIRLRSELKAMRDRLGGDDPTDAIRSEVLTAALSPTAVLPGAESGRPAVEKELIGALEPRSAYLSAVRRFLVELTRPEGPSQGWQSAFTNQPILTAILREREAVVPEERRIRELTEGLEAGGSGPENLAELLAEYRDERVADRSLVRRAEEAMQLANFPPARPGQGSTLLVVLPASGLSEPVLIEGLKRLVEQRSEQLIGGTAWSLDGEGLRRWTGAAAPPAGGEPPDARFPGSFNKAIEAAERLRAVRDGRPFQTLFVWASDLNPESLGREVRLDPPPPGSGFEWISRRPQEPRLLDGLFTTAGGFVDPLVVQGQGDGRFADALTTIGFNIDRYHQRSGAPGGVQ